VRDNEGNIYQGIFSGMDANNGTFNLLLPTLITFSVVLLITILGY